MNYNEKLKSVRQELKLSQEEMAEKLGIKQSYYSALERGAKAIPTSVIECLFKNLDVYPAWFFSSIGNMFTSGNVSDIMPGRKRISQEEIISESIQLEDLQRLAKKLQNRLEVQFTKDGIQYTEVVDKVTKLENLTGILTEVVENYLTLYKPIDSIRHPRSVFRQEPLPSYSEYKESTIKHLQQLTPLLSAIDRLNTAIESFLHDVKPLDEDEIIYL